MKKMSWVMVVAIVFCAVAFGQEQTGGKPVADKYKWVQGIFIDFGLLYNFEQIEPKPKFVSNNLMIEVGAGYDFGIISARLYGDFGFLLGGDAHWSNGTLPIKDDMDSTIGKFGIEAGFRVLNTEHFDLVIPLGFLFSWTTYKQKNPSYTASGNAYDREWYYQYTSIVSGINAKIKLGKHVKLGIPFSIGLPIFKEFEYKEILRGNYIWTTTGTATSSVKNDVDVLMFSTGLVLQVNF